jgi:hypothetical protein
LLSCCLRRQQQLQQKQQQQTGTMALQKSWGHRRLVLLQHWQVRLFMSGRCQQVQQQQEWVQMHRSWLSKMQMVGVM